MSHPLDSLIALYRNNRWVFGGILGGLVGGSLAVIRILYESSHWTGGEHLAPWILIGLGLALGLLFFTYGFSIWYQKRLIENIPTSKIRSLAMGLVEISGQAQPKVLLRAPMTATPCVYYRYLVERYQRRGRYSQWVVVSQGSSTNYFYVDDGTGRILVDPVEAEVHLAKDYCYTEGASVANTFGWLAYTARASSIGPRGYAGITLPLGKRMRYSEWYIQPGDQVYVMGSVTRWKSVHQERRFVLAERLKELKADRSRLMQFDADGDGRIDADEWERARERIEQEILRQELDNPQDETDDYVIARDPLNPVMIISDCSEKDLVKGKSLQAWGMVILGTVLVLVSVWGLFVKL